MAALIEVILPVFLVIGFGYVAFWRGLFSQSGVDGLMKFIQNFAIPCLLFRAMSSLDLHANLDLALLASYYGGALAGFLAGLIGTRLIFARPWEDAVAVGFATMFSNSVLLGLPIAQRAWGVEALAPNYAIIAFNAPFCYIIGVLAMELVRSGSGGLGATFLSVLKSLAKNPLVIGIVAGFASNLSGITLPAAALPALDMMARAALPAALFGLGGVLAQYRPEGDLKLVVWICAVSLLLHPAIVWALGRFFELGHGPFRSAVLTGAMAPGVNSYLFANMYGVARRTAATAVLAATSVSILTIWVWLALLG